MNEQLNHNTPLLEILKNGSLLDIVRLCGSGSPAFLAALVRQHTSYNRDVGKAVQLSLR